MQKAPNRQDQIQPDRSLPRSKILRGRKNFERLFEKSTVLSSNSLHFRYRLYQNPDEGCYIGFIAPKKKLKGAVQRNRVKRIMREAYRLNQQVVKGLFDKKEFGLHGVFIANQSKLGFADVEKDIISILNRLQKKLRTIKAHASGDMHSRTATAEIKKN